jgi:LAO/AO transport system kinase
MASRGGAGGLTWAVDDALKVLDAAGFEIILIETVGAGQSEVDIVKTAHTIIVVEAPGLGDDIQAIKAGILEIADIFVVNKADHPNTERTVLALKQMLEMAQPSTGPVMHHGKLMEIDTPQDEAGHASQSWEIPVLKTVAMQGKGVDLVVDTINAHFHHLKSSGELTTRNRTRLSDELHTVLQEELLRRVLAQLPAEYLSKTIDALSTKQLTPFEAAQQILASDYADD